MSKNDNQKLQAEEAQNSTLFNPDVDYEQPSDDRPYVYLVGKTMLYVNEEQFKFLREDYWEEKTENWLKSRCLIPATNLATKGDSITFSTPTIEGAIYRRNKPDGNNKHPWKAEVTETQENSETISAWYDSVYEPEY